MQSAPWRRALLFGLLSQRQACRNAATAALRSPCCIPAAPLKTSLRESRIWAFCPFKWEQAIASLEPNQPPVRLARFSDRVPGSGVTEPTEGALRAKEDGHRGSWLLWSLRRPNTRQRNHDDQAHYRIDRVGSERGRR